MTLLSILADGTTYPPLRVNDLIIRLDKGKITTGKFCKYDFLDGEEYIKEPSNAREINDEVKAFIYKEMPLFFEKRHAVFLLCPSDIQHMTKW